MKKNICVYSNVMELEGLLVKSQFSQAKSDAYLLVKENSERMFLSFLFFEREKNMRDGERGLQV